MKPHSGSRDSGLEGDRVHSLLLKEEASAESRGELRRQAEAVRVRNGSTRDLGEMDSA